VFSPLMSSARERTNRYHVVGAAPVPVDNRCLNLVREFRGVPGPIGGDRLSSPSFGGSSAG
jgi:hypothetical protein